MITRLVNTKEIALCTKMYILPSDKTAVGTDRFLHYTIYGLLAGIATDYGLDDRDSNPDEGWEFFSSPPRPDRC
jgi:hypothetical protein